MEIAIMRFVKLEGDNSVCGTLGSWALCSPRDSQPFNTASDRPGPVNLVDDDVVHTTQSEAQCREGEL